MRSKGRFTAGADHTGDSVRVISDQLRERPRRGELLVVVFFTIFLPTHATLEPS